ncbi:MAG: RluA family pseudouridine synthase [Spirochaetales bacterium]|nr:RluA family pseudouridine synthase [Spirochaetales bacterium]
MKVFYIQLKKDERSALGNLVREYLSMTKEKAEELIRIGAVWDTRTKRRLKDTDAVVTSDRLIRINMPVRAVVPYPFDSRDIVVEEDEFLVVYKKPGFPTIPAPYADVASLSWGLERYLRSVTKTGKAFPVNRLDTPASGLLFFAKNARMQVVLNGMFKERTIKKYYLVKTKFFRSVKRSYTITDTLAWKGKEQPAVTRIWLMHASDDACCFLVRPETGRTHQIRRHFQQYLVPICGDTRYGNDRGEKRLALLCFAYIFRHPVTGKKVKVSHLPDGIMAPDDIF